MSLIKKKLETTKLNLLENKPSSDKEQKQSKIGKRVDTSSISQNPPKNGQFIKFDNHPKKQLNWVAYMGTQCFKLTLKFSTFGIQTSWSGKQKMSEQRSLSLPFYLIPYKQSLLLLKQFISSNWEAIALLKMFLIKNILETLYPDFFSSCLCFRVPGKHSEVEIR